MPKTRSRFKHAISVVENTAATVYTSNMLMLTLLACRAHASVSARGAQRERGPDCQRGTHSCLYDSCPVLPSQLSHMSHTCHMVT